MTRFCLALVLFAAIAPAAMAADDETARAERWNDLRQSFFGQRPILEGSDKISLDAPDRAMDAALVPVTINVANPSQVKAVYLLIDDNPAPLAAHVAFGPAGDPRSLKLRVRVNQYTYIHAVEETLTGELFATRRFVKAAGGCSAPAGSYDPAALADIGRMKLRASEQSSGDGSVEAQLLVRHPNFNGMQMDQVTRLYTPARFLKTIEATYNNEIVFRLETDISMATDPAITFGVRTSQKGKLAVSARDSSGALFESSFDLGPQGS
ncbi:quinoprotein dehydrogenase-associated SoxYZ-like carrier [Methylocapsa palsarum]|uniref:Sulfur-oxidizing protein SoxY n=1 Tax=Methylocapsa palsarum TaxID=1612308 RepID=A0A1I3YFR0_9HYPH|nr:quinoprotein dehydrogenase-associated SoxYZ-like carrier [Methylocapsa palsarum]SFK30101.1 sulfur-oxidizing protein SoxY [Methylocapsa palsarum]